MQTIKLSNKKDFLTILEQSDAPSDAIFAAPFFTAALLEAIENKRRSNFDDKVFGIPIDAYIVEDDNKVKKLFILVSPYRKSGETKDNQDTYTYEVNLSDYYVRGPGNSIPTKFEFSSIKNDDYITIIFSI